MLFGINVWIEIIYKESTFIHSNVSTNSVVVVSRSARSIEEIIVPPKFPSLPPLCVVSQNEPIPALPNIIPPWKVSTPLKNLFVEEFG